MIMLKTVTWLFSKITDIIKDQGCERSRVCRSNARMYMLHHVPCIL